MRCFKLNIVVSEDEASMEKGWDNLLQHWSSEATGQSLVFQPRTASTQP